MEELQLALAPAPAGRRYWERHAARYDRATRFLSRPVPRMLALTADAVRGVEVALEVGAGTGLVTAAIAPVVGTVIATDFAAEMVAQLERRLRAEGLANAICRQADLYALPVEAHRVDAVVAANVLHLVPDLPRALARLREALRPGGLLVAPTYLHRETLRASLLSRLFALTGFPGRRRFDAGSLRAAVEAAGFAVEAAEVIAGPFPIGFIAARAT